MLKKLIVVMIGVFICTAAYSDCPSSATLHIKSSNYSGSYNIQLREGGRPGSKLISTRSLADNGTVMFSSVCPGKYFFAFGTPDSNSVSVTRYFEIKNDGDSYSIPEITVTYSRTHAPGSQPVGTAKKQNL